MKDPTPELDGELTAMLPRAKAAVEAVGLPRGDRRWSALGASELLDAYAAGVTTPTDVVADCFAQIAMLDGRLDAVWTLDEAGALTASEISAARWQAGTPRPLEGVPILVKDLLDTAGLRTTGGSRVYADRVPDDDAAVVAAARSAGAIVLAKTSTFELGCGKEETPWGTVRNPWDPSHTTGGSSSGSAAGLAARYAPLALGTDTGGSVRIPASFCGVTGLKPTLGRIRTDDVALALAPTLDAVGPMARSARDARRLFDVLAGASSAPESGDAAPSTGPPLAGVRLGVPRTWFYELLTGPVRAAAEQALDAFTALGATVTDVAIPVAHHGGPLSWLITMAEASRVYSGVPRAQMTSAFRRRLEIGDQIDDSTYLEALRARRGLTAQVVDAISGVDAVVMPTTVSCAPRFDALDAPVEGVSMSWPDVSARQVALWNVTGLPAVSVPMGADGDLPLGLQIAGRPFADERCLSIAAAYQSVTDHHLQVPRLVSSD